MVSATLALSIEDFYEELYVENLAFVLGIDPARIRVVSVVAGSVILTATISPTAEEVAALSGSIPDQTFDTSNNIDAEVRCLRCSTRVDFRR